MSKFKKTNRKDMVTILVGKDNQALASGTLVNGTTAFNINDGQLGMLSMDHDGVVSYGTFVGAANADVADVAAIQLMAGTPNSSQIHRADPWEIDAPPVIKSGVIHRDNIRSVTTSVLTVGTQGMFAVTDVTTPVADAEYGGFIYINSVRNDRDWSDNDEVISEVVKMPASVAGITDVTDYMLNNLLFKFNTRSKIVSTSNSAMVRRGNRDFVVLGINSGGGSGQALGTITCAGTPTSFDVINDYNLDGTAVTTQMTATPDLVTGFAKLIKQQADAVAGGATITNQITAASTIEVIDLQTAGAAANIDCFVVIGLDQKIAPYKDDIAEVKTRVSFNPSKGLVDYYTTQVMPGEWVGEARTWSIYNSDRPQLNVHTRQNVPHGEFFSEGFNAIDPTKLYTSTIIEYFDYEEAINKRQVHPKKAIILLDAGYTCTTVTLAVTALAAGPALATANNNATTVTALNNVVTAWFETARVYTGHRVIGDATTSAYFV